MGFYMSGKNESAPFVFSYLKTEKTETQTALAYHKIIVEFLFLGFLFLFSH